MQLEEFISRLDGPKKSGNDFIALCPAHEDRTPSLSVATGEGGRILIKCHAGCTTKDVVNAMGLDIGDLFADEAHSTTRTRVSIATSSPSDPPPVDPPVIEGLCDRLSDEDREYLKNTRMLSDEVIDHYRLGYEEPGGERRLTIPIADEQGMYRDVRRWLPPERRTAQSAKMKHWRTGYGGSRLYPVDQLLSDELVLCEGELDALALISHGIPAITATCGASTWQDWLSEVLADKTLTILLDHDDAGQKGAQKRAESLLRRGAKVKVALWPNDRDEGWDATDELKAHGPESVKRILSEAITSILPQGGFVSFGSAFMGDGPEIIWSDPLPLPVGLPDVEPFELDLLPDAFRSWIEDIAERMQCPTDFAAISAVVRLGAVVGRQIGIRPKRQDDWTVIPNLWGGIVGRPSVLKSPAMQESRKAVGVLETKAREAHEEEIRKYESRRLVAEAESKNAKKNIETEIVDGNKTKALEYALTVAYAEEEKPPGRRRYELNDPTSEKLIEIHRDNARGLLVHRDELVGFLKTLDKDGREGDRSLFLESWNGDSPYTQDRIGRGTIEIPALCVSILGSIQPGPISAYISRAARGAADDDGLVQRFQLLVWPDLPANWKYVDRQPDREARNSAWAVYERLDAIDAQQIGAECPEGEVPFLRFSDDAQELFIEWLTELEQRLRQAEHPLLEAHLGKYRSLVPSLALLIHLADVGHGPVGLDALEKACAWADYLESHARRVYAPAMSPATVAAQSLAKHITKGDLEQSFTIRNLKRKNWQGLPDRETCVEAVELLEDLGWIQREPKPQEDKGGRPSDIYHVNPKLREGHERSAENLHTPNNSTAKTAKTSVEEGFGSFGSA